MNVPFLIAAAIAFLATGIHGVVGERLVLRPLFSGGLPPIEPSPRATMSMLRVTWHIATLTFLAFGVGLGVCGLAPEGAACTGVGIGAAATFGGFFTLAVVVALPSKWALLSHPGPAAFLLVAALSWWGAVSL